ncbi:ankyrin repeat domain-containing protein [Gloeocapsopsis crepidinum LEGE 06123]|uniref:Ankyrin repeat domain-containing protein n=1 Tax=Gloeocapsopsis crepidinum LEGE 06123 TaxID=588587 RepID=A0ABR9UX28_9CHRO|nr:ankyrin repeat domain-containing protein [Gloeocapsopsis crepidinum]MBE9192867.1 ankyrin repeat domain-containing protein [Gloeocapsopsis crepidinum LEGE 06123]
MSQEETQQVAEKWFKALDQADYATAMSCLADDIEWINLQPVKGVSDIIPWIGTSYGVAEVTKSFQTRDRIAQVKVFKPVDLVVQGDQAFGTVHDITTVEATGLTFDITFATWMQIRDGKIVKWKSYCDPSPIIAAFRGDMRSRLIEAVENDDLETVTILLQQGADPNTRNPGNGLTVLMTAACHANVAMAKLLLNASADVFTTDSKTGATALHKACQGGSVEVAQLLLDAGAFIDAVTPTMGHTPIMDALWYKWPELVRLLVERGANLYLSTHYGFTLEDHLNFELNVNQGEEKQKFIVIQEIIDAGRKATRESIDSQKVMAATNQGDLDTVKQLIENQADVNTVYPHVNSFLDGHTPLLVAARDGHTEIVRELLKAGAKVRVEDWVFKGAPIHKATYNGNPEILKMLVEHPDIDLDVQGPINGYTPLHDALWHGYSECAEILINAGAKLELIGHDGKTALDIAVDVFGSNGEIPQLIHSKLAGTK